jgi:hypothetical protein
MALSRLRKVLPVFSSVYFGEIPYYQALAEYKEIYIDPLEYYKKQTWRSRTCILTGNGPLILSVPVERLHGKETRMQEALISEEVKDWRKDHWKAIESAYMHAPYFFYYGEQVKELIYQPTPYLLEFNRAILQQVLNWLDLSIHVKSLEKPIQLGIEKDYRILLNSKKFIAHTEPYIQVFSDKMDFIPQLSILDLLMNQGPLARKYVVKKSFSTLRN